MAIYHLTTKIISRGKSAVAAAAYRSGTVLKHGNVVHDFSDKTGVVLADIMLPNHVDKKFLDRNFLWNEVHKAEKREDAQFAREVEIALPKELNRAAQIDLVKSFVWDQFVKKGMIADIAIHDTGKGNPHVHILLTTREIDDKGLWKPKSKTVYKLDKNGQKIPVLDARGVQKTGSKGRKLWQRTTVKSNDWDSRATLKGWRSAWAAACNERLKMIGVELIDHRSHKDRGLKAIPTIKVGIGRQADLKAEINREVKEFNQKLLEIERLKEAEERARTAAVAVKSIDMTKSGGLREEEKPREVKAPAVVVEPVEQAEKVEEKVKVSAAKEYDRVKINYNEKPLVPNGWYEGTVVAVDDNRVLMALPKGESVEHDRAALDAIAKTKAEVEVGRRLEVRYKGGRVLFVKNSDKKEQKIDRGLGHSR